MSIKQVCYVTTGIWVPELPGSRDTYLPFIEGHPGADLDIIEEEDGNFFVGRILSRSDPYEESTIAEFTIPSSTELALMIQKYLKISVNAHDIRNYFLSIWE